MEATSEGGDKTRRKQPSGKIYRPRDLTEERPETVALQYSIPNERIVMPPRARQTDLTLLPPGMHVRGGAFLECLAHNNSWHTMSPDEALKHMASNDLMEEIQKSTKRTNAAAAAQADLEKARANANYARMSTIDSGHINKMTPKSLSAVSQDVLKKELKEQEVKFFMDDPMPLDDDDDEDGDAEDDDESRGPGDFPVLQMLYSVNGKAYLRRYETLRDASMAGHRDIEIVNKSHNDTMCEPIRKRTTYRHCAKGRGCVCYVKAAQLGQAEELGYIGREYLTPKQLAQWDERRYKGLPVSIENDGPVGLCYHDLVEAVHARLTTQSNRLKGTPPETINPFSVRVGEGEYASEVCWGSMDSNVHVAVGVSGRFPMHLNICRQYVPKTPPGESTFFYLAEVNADFQPRLSQANMCLGTFKSQPICNIQTGKRFVTASSWAIFTPRWSLETLVGADWPEWIRFTRNLYRPILADRQLLFPVETTVVNKKIPAACERVPTAWLRRTLLFLTPSLLEDRVRLSLSTTHEEAIAAQFHVTRLGPLLFQMLDVTLCSFERSVAHFRAWRRDPIKAHWITTMFRHMTDYRLCTPGWEPVYAFFQHYPLPPPPEYNVASDYTLWACVLWRLAVGILVESLVPAADPNQRLRENYQWRLYRGTHYNLCTACCGHRRMDDAWLLTVCPPCVPVPANTAATPTQATRAGRPWPWLALVYPSCHAVMCAEEAPALALTQTYAGHWFDMGNRKKQKMIVSAIVQSFLLKCKGRPCLGRNEPEMRGRVVDHFPITYELFSMIVQCIMLGHFPAAVEPLSLLALVRINASFGRLASVGAAARFKAFTSHMRMVPRLFLALFDYSYTLPQCPVLWDHHQSQARSLLYVTVLHESDAIWRRDIGRQVTSLTSHVEWNDIETPASVTPDGAKLNATGRMVGMHERALQFYTKIKKGRFEEVLRRKLTAVESELGDLRIEEQVAKLLEKERMQWILFVAWTCAQRSHSPYAPDHAHVMFTLKYLHALGMKKRAVRMLRPKCVQYECYDQHDDSLKAWAKSLYAVDPFGYHVLKTFLVAFDHYRNQRPMLLSLREKRLTLRALRCALDVEPHSVSPPLMGVAHYCEGCRSCANDVTEPGGIVLNDLDTIARVVAESKRPAWTPQSLAYGFNARDADVAGFDKAYYNPSNGRLYCRRRRGEPLKGAAALAPALDLEGAAAVDPAEVLQERREVLFENMAEDGERLTTRTLVNAFADLGVTDAGADGEGGGVKKKKGKASSKDRDLVTRRALGATLLNCAQPMIEIDLVGIVWRNHTRCVVCGRPIVGHSAQQTNDGMTCGKHVNVEAFADYHRNWWVWNISRHEAEQVLRPNAVRVVPCCLCGSRHETRLLRTYDFTQRLFKVSFCDAHLAPLEKLMAVRDKNACLPPVRYDHLVAAAQGYQRKMYM